MENIDSQYEELDKYYMTGVVEDINDPKKKARVKVRIERLHGRKEDREHIPTEHLPWYDPFTRGTSFIVPKKGTVVHVGFENGNYYVGQWISIEHFNINLQEKAESLNDKQYSSFFSIFFNDKHQYYHTDKEGVKFDYEKSNINMKPNGDVNLNLRDNNSNLNLGTEDASQQAMLGNSFLTFFDELIGNLMGSKGGPYLGNLGTPIIPNPQMLTVLNKYMAFRHTFISNHVRIVDNFRVKSQNRGFDKITNGDNYTNEDLSDVNNVYGKSYSPEERPPSNDVPEGVPSNVSNENIKSHTVPENPTEDDLLKTKKPFSEEIENGKIPIEQLTVSKFLSNSFDDERKYLINEVAVNLDSLIDKYNSVKKTSWPDIKATNGYNNYERQQNIKKQFPITAPPAGKNPFGFANQFEVYMNINTIDTDVVAEAKETVRGKRDDIKYDQNKALGWLIDNALDFNIKLAGNDFTGSPQWWHWIYKQ